MTTISNTSPLLSFAKIGRLDLLEAICKSVLIPEAVHNEVMARPHRPDAQAIAGAGWIRVTAVRSQRAVRGLIRTEGLHRGESEVLVLARELKADRIILDDLAARHVASRRRLPFIGTLGLLLLAKSLHLIPKVETVMNDLVAAGRYIDPATLATSSTLPENSSHSKPTIPWSVFLWEPLQLSRASSGHHV